MSEITHTHAPLRLRVLRSGSSGNATLVDAGDTKVIVDAGFPAEGIVRELATIAVAKGATALARIGGAAILANEGTIAAAGLSLHGARVERFTTGRPFAVGSLQVEAFLVPHDAVEPVGFVISRNGRRIVIATDLGEVTEELIERARGAAALVIEANYDLRLLSVSPYPWFLKNRILSPTGHLSNDAAGRAVVAAASDQPQTVFLVHLSDINNLTPLARDTVVWALERQSLHQVRVEVVRPHGASQTLVIGDS